MGYRTPPPHHKPPLVGQAGELYKSRGRHVENITTPITIWWQGYTSFDVAFPCFYRIPKPRPMHKLEPHMPPHPDWKDQGRDTFVKNNTVFLPCFHRPGHVCDHTPFRHCCHKCPAYIEMSELVPIHLLGDYERYSSAYFVAFDDDNTPQTWQNSADIKCYIDTDEDWIIRLHLPKIKSQQKFEDSHYWFTIGIHANPIVVNSNMVRHERDQIVVRGQLIIDPTCENRMISYVP